jgi:hypothetical protein
VPLGNTANTVVDALSRRHANDAEALALSAPTFALFNDLRAEVNFDPALRVLKEGVASSMKGDTWRLVDGLVTVGNRIYVPRASPLLVVVLSSAHNNSHEGTEKTLHRLRADFFVSEAHEVVREFVRAYITCQRNKSEHLHPAGLLQPMEVPTTMWADIAMDFMEEFPRLNGKLVILIVVDWFSKYAQFMPLGHPYTVTTVTRAFFNNMVKLHGVPGSIISGRDPVFTGHFWQELFCLAGVKL